MIENHGLFEKTSQSGVRNNYSDIYVPFDNLTGAPLPALAASSSSRGNSPGQSDTGSYTTSGTGCGGGSIRFAGGRTLGSTVQMSGNVSWMNGEVTGTLPSGATLLVETAGCSTCDTIGNGTLDVTGGELALVGNNSFIAMTGSARLVNSGTVNFTTDGAIGGDSSAVIENHGPLREDLPIGCPQ